MECQAQVKGTKTEKAKTKSEKDLLHVSACLIQAEAAFSQIHHQLGGSFLEKTITEQQHVGSSGGGSLMKHFPT